MSELEQRLQRAPLKVVPPELRSEILAAAARAASTQAAPSLPGGFLAALQALLWPHPKAWAGLAAAWVVIVALHFGQGNDVPFSAETAALPSPEMVVELRQQQLLLAELLGVSEIHEADRPRNRGHAPHTQAIRFKMA